MRTIIKVKDGLEADDLLSSYRIKVYMVEDEAVEISAFDYEKAILVLKDILLEENGRNNVN